MADVNEQGLALLQQIARDTDRMRRAMEALCTHLGVPRGGAQGAGTRSVAAPVVASDRELDSQYGDPKVILDPRDWPGESYKGGPMSAAPAEFLDLLADVLDRFADEESDEKKKKYKRSDAAKARGWARRKRAQTQATPAEEF